MIPKLKKLEVRLKPRNDQWLCHGWWFISSKTTVGVKTCWYSKRTTRWCLCHRHIVFNRVGDTCVSISKNMPQQSRLQPALTTKIQPTSHQILPPGPIQHNLPLNKHLSHLSARRQAVIILFLISHHILDHNLNFGAVGGNWWPSSSQQFFFGSRAAPCFALSHNGTWPDTPTDRCMAKLLRGMWSTSCLSLLCVSTNFMHSRACLPLRFFSPGWVRSSATYMIKSSVGTQANFSD